MACCRNQDLYCVYYERLPLDLTTDCVCRQQANALDVNSELIEYQYLEFPRCCGGAALAQMLQLQQYHGRMDY
jgi:hypothetical protein